MKIDRVWSCRSIKCHKNFKTAEQYLHQVNIMLLELDMRMLLYFFQKIIRYIVKIMFELPQIVRLCDFFRWLCDQMRL